MDIGPFDVDLLFNTLNRILDRRGLKSEDLVLDEISRDEFTIEECTENLLKRLEACKRMSFSNLLGKDSTRNEIISYFLSLLELIRLKIILVRQDEAFSDLIIIKNEMGAG